MFIYEHPAYLFFRNFEQVAREGFRQEGPGVRLRAVLHRAGVQRRVQGKRRDRLAGSDNHDDAIATDATV